MPSSTWQNPEVEATLRRHGPAFCSYEINCFLSPKTVTADFVYVRLHGPDGAYAGSYDTKALRQWAGETRVWGLRRQRRAAAFAARSLTVAAR